MATEIIPTNEYPLPKNSYTAFDAISLRNLIIERLNNQGIFTDQNYIGSNLASIIDIISYSFNTLMFYLNRTSTESMFTEAQLYENINRIVKLLDYKPIGYQTSTLAFQCSASNLETGIFTIPRYSYLSIGQIPFSFNEDITFKLTEGTVVQELTDISNRKLLFQGIYRETPIYTAFGDENETLTIDSANNLIDHFNIDVYVFEVDQNRWIQYNNTPSFYATTPLSRLFEKRLNSNLNYEIVFGDGINSRKLESGDKVLIYYLQSTGNIGVVGPGTINNSSKSLYSSQTFNDILADTTDGFQFLTPTQFNNILFNNIVGSTVPKNIETVDEIRKNATSNFKSQYRLVTKEDFETFIKTNHNNFINDVKVFSNWEYAGQYLKYFNSIQVTPTSFRQILLNHVLYADSCNFNNIYICAIPKTSQTSTLKYLLPAQKEIILSDIQQLKTLTSELTFIDPIVKALSFGLKSAGSETINIEDRAFCQLEINKQLSNKKSAKSIESEVIVIFQKFFNPTNNQLGTELDINNLTAEILAIDGVESVVTRRLDTNESFNGISMFCWNPTFPDLDKNVVTNNLKLMDFEYLYFDQLFDIASKIEVIES